MVSWMTDHCCNQYYKSQWVRIARKPKMYFPWWPKIELFQLFEKERKYGFHNILTHFFVSKLICIELEKEKIQQRLFLF